MAKQNPVEMLQSLNSDAREGRLDPIDFLERNFLLEGSLFLKRPIRFEPWQKEHVLRPVFERIQRQLDTFLVGVPKKNGKSTLGSCIGTGALLLDDSFPEVYGVAGDKDQAKVVFEFTKKAFERSPALKQLVRIYRDVIERIDGNGYYRVLSSDSSGKHGRNPSCVIWDELWNQPGYDLWEALTISPARANPFHFVITYSGYQARAGNLLWDLYSQDSGRGMDGCV
jgi:phage terminase large subunit-like protein